jgi:signal transduction histidine kinase
VLVFLDVSELRRLEEIRRDFVANASHELKTPLTVLRGYSETLLDPELPPDLARKFIGVVKANADRLQRIIDELLDLSRIEAGGWRVQPERVNIAELARSAWDVGIASGAGASLTSEAASVNRPEVGFVTEIAPGHAELLADPAAMLQVLTNLFSNAVRYTPAGGRVTFRTRAITPREQLAFASGGRLSRDRSWTVIEVSDTGVGIARPHLARIFERFYRADPSRAREAGGTGLGLAIVKHLIEAHGGAIEAESEVGRGTTIRFFLPTYTLS